MTASARRRGAILAVLVVAQTLGIANANLIAVALPALSSALEPSAAQQQWIVDAYVLVLASALMCAGALGDRWGRRRLLLAGLTTFAVASLACALANDPTSLIALRAVQALGPAMILPASLAILLVTFPDRHERARAIGVWGAASGLGVALGPLLGGVVVSTLGWRWAFGVNTPVALLLAVLAVRLVSGDRVTPAAHRLDWGGALLITGAMAATVFAIIQVPHDGWASLPVGVAAFLAVALTMLLVRAERRHPDPLIDFSLLGRRGFLGANVAAATILFVTLGGSVYLSTFMQTYRDASALQAGLALLPLGVGTALLAVVGGRLTAHISARRQIAAGLACGCVGAAMLSRLAPHADPESLLPGLLLLGAGSGMALPAATATAVTSVPPTKAGTASAIHNAARQLGATLGVAVLGSIVVAKSGAHTATAFADGLQTAMLTASVCLACAALALLVLTRATGRSPGS